jgi:hypothetical protein
VFFRRGLVGTRGGFRSGVPTQNCPRGRGKRAARPLKKKKKKKKQGAWRVFGGRLKARLGVWLACSVAGQGKVDKAALLCSPFWARRRRGG